MSLGEERHGAERSSTKNKLRKQTIHQLQFFTRGSIELIWLVIRIVVCLVQRRAQVALCVQTNLILRRTKVPRERRE